MTDAEVKAELGELHVVALTIWGEARGEPIEGKVFVGSIIRNRVQTPRRFGDTFDKVCLARSQFSCWWRYGGESNFKAVMAQARRFVGDYADASAVATDPALEECVFVAEGIIGGRLQDRSFGANHYLTVALWKAKPPEWTKGQKPVVVCGRHVGFKII